MLCTEVKVRANGSKMEEAWIRGLIVTAIKVACVVYVKCGAIKGFTAKYVAWEINKIICVRLINQ